MIEHLQGVKPLVIGATAGQDGLGVGVTTIAATSVATTMSTRIGVVWKRWIS